MSGDLCQPHPTAKQKTISPLSPQSRIPVSSPSPLRRWGSLRARGEGDNQPFIKTPKISPEANQNGTLPKGLQRGYSFMERGERRRGSHGVRPCTTSAPRPQNATTEPRNPGALNRAGGGGAPQTPTRNRSLSLSLSNAVRNTAKSPLAVVAGIPKTPPSSPDTRHHNQQYRDWDLESVASTTSGLSVASCDHASVARNGTTFSGRSKRYVVHCSEHSGATGEDYLTPTQRAHKEVKKLKYILNQTQRELDLKDTDILRLTKEVVELRLYKAALNSPEDKSNSSSDAITVREVNLEDHDVGDMVENHLGAEQTSSCADSGHYEDLTNSSVHSKDSVNIGEDISLSPYKAKTPVETADKAITVDLGPRDPHSEHQRLVVEYERRLQDLIRSHEEECHQMKQKHNDKVDELLQRLSEVNTRYWELVPDLDTARERIKELEQQLDEACKKLEEQVDKHKEAYLKMYNQGREAGKLEQDSQVADTVPENPSRISVPDLLHQLEVTQNELDKVKAMYRQLLEARSKNKIDPEITLQFLKSAIYYFLTDRENNQGHLRAIQSILGFTPSEISNIDKARMT